MSASLWGGEVTLTVEAAFSAATAGSTYGIWDDGALGAWDSALWGPDEVFADISADARYVSTSRRFSREVQTWQTGTGSLVLNNRSANYSADNLSGIYVSGGVTQIRPWRAVRIRATYAGVTYPIARMYATDWVESYPTQAATNAGDAIVTAPLVDEFARLAGYDGAAVTPVGAADLFGARVHRILDNAGYTGDRSIESGTATMQATTLAGSTISLLNLTADSEGGAVYVGPSGELIAEGQYALATNSRSITSQATFGDNGSEIPYVDMQISGSGDLITNIVSYTRVGGAVQTVSDISSRALYGDRKDTRTDLICETDVQALGLASWKLARFKDPERRVTSVTINPRRSPSTMYPVALGLKVRDLVTVKRRPPGGITITQLCHIAGIRHSITPEGWLTTFDLFSAQPYYSFSASYWDSGIFDTSVWFF